MRDVDVLAMTLDCKTCHQQEYASWHAGPHSATYSQIFADPVHNSKRMLMDDCLRCHGMHFNGSIRDLVQPLNTKGPWRVIPFGPRRSAGDALHDVPPGPQRRRAGNQASLAHLGRRRGRSRFAGLLRPARDAALCRRVAFAFRRLHDGARTVTVSQDPRQALCYQCHAPREPEAGSMAATNAGDRRWAPATIARRWACTRASVASPATMAITRTRALRARPAIRRCPIAGSTWRRWIPPTQTRRAPTTFIGSSAPIAISTAYRRLRQNLRSKRRSSPLLAWTADNRRTPEMQSSLEGFRLSCFGK